MAAVGMTGAVIMYSDGGNGDGGDADGHSDGGGADGSNGAGTVVGVLAVL